MKIPPKPPKLEDIFLKKSGELSKALRDPEFLTLIARWNNSKEYYYWDSFRYLKFPNGISPEIAWACREFSHVGEVKYVPIIDKEDKPFGYWLPARAQEWLHLIDREVPFETIHKTAPAGGEKERYILASLMEEAIASSQMEGAATTRKNAKNMLISGTAPKNKSEQMIFNNYKTIARIKELKEEKLTVEMILELHRLLTHKTMPEESMCGYFRATEKDDEVKVYDFDETLLYDPPKHEQVAGLVEKLVDFANNDGDEHFIHPVVKGIMLHYWLSFIHPFLDGNGRTARGLFYWYMLKKGYWIFEYISISRVVMKTYGQYKRAFLFSELSNDLTYFVMYNLRVIRDAIHEAALYIDRKQKAQRQAMDLLRKVRGVNPRQRELLAWVFKNPDEQLTIAKHAAFHSVVYQTARADLLGLAGMGYLEQMKDGKKLVFVTPEGFHEKIKSLISPGRGNL
jgi:Fic family protein